MVGAGNDPAGLGAGLAGTGSRGAGADVPRPVCPSGYRGRAGTDVFPGPVGQKGHAQETGEVPQGLPVLAEALAAAHNRGERYCEAELHRLKGELLLLQSADQHAEAEASLHHALAIARRQQAKSLELRAAMSLGRLWQQQGKAWKRTLCSRRSTAGSPRALTPLTSRKPRHCSQCSRERNL